jgi:hypothetical protein
MGGMMPRRGRRHITKVGKGGLLHGTVIRLTHRGGRCYGTLRASGEEFHFSLEGGRAVLTSGKGRPKMSHKQPKRSPQVGDVLFVLEVRKPRLRSWMRVAFHWVFASEWQQIGWDHAPPSDPSIVALVAK